jgi:hypothetical protein
LPLRCHSPRDPARGAGSQGERRSVGSAVITGVTSRGVDSDDFEAYRTDIERLLELVRERHLPSVTCDRIRFAVKYRSDPGHDESMLRATDAEELGFRFVATMRDADRELPPEEVKELDRLIDDGLPSPDRR